MKSHVDETTYSIESMTCHILPGMNAREYRLKSPSSILKSILAIRDIGIQVKTTYWGGYTVSRFINRLKIEDIIINEGISFWQIKSYMAILVKDEAKMIVVFEHLLPRLRPVLLDVYKGTRDIIFNRQYK
ncbi:GPI-GlcNAc transferase complex, PIG-H component-domain-containing protein [Pilobolus umbonatus]|nr:GPI-GlcNAc transferase complex, PIG-H component-domain-containing protein [Pilobolus umbonatus]